LIYFSTLVKGAFGRKFLLTLTTGLLFASSPAFAEKPLALSMKVGGEQNSLYRDGPISAHVTLKPGNAPRLVVAFPAGNSGVGMWFKAENGPVSWNPVGTVRKLSRSTAAGPLYGIRTTVSANSSSLSLQQALLSNVRVLRDYGHDGRIPDGILVKPVISGDTISWARPRLDGAAGYALKVRILGGRIAEDNGAIRFVSQNGRKISLQIEALSGDAPLKPITAARLFTPDAKQDSNMRNVLEFLSYEDKFLAGSWRYNTYFGRDSMMSLYMLQPALQKPAIEAGIVAVLARLSPKGEVAHEEDIGEFAVLAHRAAGQPLSDKPIFDYKMVDDDFMLAPLAASYLLDHASPAEADSFLKRTLPSGETYASALARNFAYVLDAAMPFAKNPHYSNLIGLKPGSNVGEWRDSEHGLGGGRYSYNINGVFVPAALEGIDRLLALPAFKQLGDKSVDAQQVRMAHSAWHGKASALFDVSISQKEALSEVNAYAASQGVAESYFTGAIANDGVRFKALVLNEKGVPIRVMNSDEGFEFLFLKPPADQIENRISMLMKPFPAGLFTDAGLLVSNPAYAGQSYWANFDQRQYHGAVVWGWQQAVLAAGLNHQLARTDLPASTRNTLLDARTRLWKVINAHPSFKTSELWSWSFRDGSFVPEAYGQRENDQTESQVVQLWSVALLGIKEPGGK
jgi:hypothetical protein